MIRFVKRILLPLIALYTFCVPRAYCGDGDTTLFLSLAIPGLGAVYAGTLEDYEGIKQVGYTMALTAHNVVFFKEVINKKRPDGTSNNAFPSGHTAYAFAGATFLYRRYGMEWGLPTYAAAALIGATRINKDKHDWADVIGGAAIGTLYGFLFTSKYPSVWLDPKYDPKRKKFMLNFTIPFKG